MEWALISMKLKKLFKDISVKEIKGSKEVEITGLCSNSKLIAPGNLFIAKKGLTHDGSRFIPDAIAAGAAAVLTDIYNPFLGDIVQIIHPDVAQVEAELAARFYNHPAEALFLVGITGTNGKTTVSYLVKHLLDHFNLKTAVGPCKKVQDFDPEPLDAGVEHSQKVKATTASRGSGSKDCAFLPASTAVFRFKETCGLIGTIEWIVGKNVFPSTMTTADLITNYKLFYEMAANGCKSAVMEVSSHALDQGRVCSIDFDVAIFTNLTQDHLDYHHTMEHYAESKARLFSSLLPESKKPFVKTAVVNIDSPWADRMLKECKVQKITYGITSAADLTAKNIRLNPQGMQFVVCYRKEEIPFRCPLIGRYNIYNCLAAIAVLLSRSFPLEKILKVLESFSKVAGRLERVSNRRGLNIFVDYAHTDDALKNVLATLHEIKKGKIITVFGCGGNREAGKRPKMAAAAEAFSDEVIVTSDNPRNEDPLEIIQQILPGFSNPNPRTITVIPDRAEAIYEAVRRAGKEDIVLIAGKGHETYQIFAQKTIHFDDRIVAQQACDAFPASTAVFRFNPGLCNMPFAIGSLLFMGQ